MRHAIAAVLLLAVSHAGSAESPAPAPLSIDEATEKATNWGFGLSPSGRYLASIRRFDNTSVVVIADLEDETAPPALRPIPNSVALWFQWASDDRVLVAARFWIDKHGEVIPSSKFDDPLIKGQSVVRLFGIDRDGGNLKLMFAGNDGALWSQSLANIVGWQDNRRRAMIPAWQYSSYDLMGVDVHTGEATRVAKGTPRTFQWFADRNGDPAFRIDSTVSGKYAWVYARKGPADVPYDKIQWERVQSIRLKHEDDQAPPDFWPVAFGPEPNTYYVSARPDGADTAGLYLYDYVQQKFVKTIATDPVHDTETVVTDFQGNMIGFGYYTDRKVYKFVDKKVQAYFNAADRYFGGDVDTYLQDTSVDGAVWLLYTNGPRDSGSWHIFRLKDKHIREVTRAYPGIDPRRLAPARILRYKARDGLELTGYLTLPPTYKPGDKPPLVMMPHGGPASRDTYQYDPLVQLLATRGYQVFQPNFRGSAGFGRRFLEMGHGTWGTAMQDDLTDGVDFLVKSGLANAARVCIVGGSYGGYAALAGVTLTPDLYRCAVSLAGVAHLRKQLRFERRTSIGDEEHWIIAKRQFGDPDADETRLEATSPAALAGRVKAPVLLIHGALDQVVPIEQSEIMHKALRQAQKEVHFVKFDEMGHSPNLDERKKIYPKIVDFLQKHLPTEAAAP